MVKGKEGRKRLSRPLSPRFMEAIDAAAMRTGDTNSDEYLEAWKASESVAIEGDAESCLDNAVEEIEKEYSKGRLISLIKNGGYEPPQ